MTDLGPGIPETLKHYRLVRRLGTGGMGAVFEAVDRRVDTRVAIKILHSHLALEESFRERFEREAHVAALLRSPYTVHLIDYGEDQGLYFLVMEYIDGESVAQRIMAEGRLDPRRAVSIAADAARALEEAGARGVVHRDIKPDNILLGKDGSVKVADFGIARRVGGGGDLMATAGFIGTSAYAAPEQSTGDDVDHRVDIYALGGTLYCMLTGQPPFSGTAQELLRQHRESPIPMAPLAGLPDQLINIVRRCMEKEREDRYPDAGALVGALERALRTLSSPGARTTDPAVSAPTAVGPVTPSRAPLADTFVSGSASAPASAAPGPPAEEAALVVPPPGDAPSAGGQPRTETVVSSAASFESQGSGGGTTPPPPAPFASPGPPAGGGTPRSRGFYIGIALAGVIGVGAIAAIVALLSGGGGETGTSGDEGEEATARAETRTIRTREARVEQTRDARTAAAASAEPTSTETPTATTEPPTATATVAVVVDTTTRIVAGDWTYNFVTVSNTCGSGPQLGEEFENLFTLIDADGDGYVNDGEDVTIIDGQSGNNIGTFTFTYPAFTFQAELEDGDFVVLRNQYIGDSTGSSLREDHYTVDGRPCVIAFQD